MKKFLIILLIGSNALAACDDIRSSRDNAKFWCCALATASTGVAVCGGLVSPFLGLAGLIPGTPAHHFCEKWKKLEGELADCMGKNSTQAKAPPPAKETKKEAPPTVSREDMQKYEKRQEEIAAEKLKKLEVLKKQYDEREYALRGESNNQIKKIAEGYIQQGKNLKDPQVREEFKKEVKTLEDLHQKAKDDLSNQYYKDMSAITNHNMF